MMMGLLLSLVIGGCGSSEENDDTASLQIQRLQSLPYAGSSPAKKSEADGVVTHDVQRTSPGYNLYTIYALGTAELIAADGTVVRFWSGKDETWMHTSLMSNGDLLVVGAAQPVSSGPGKDAFLDDATRFVERFNWQGRLLWKKPFTGHHDITVTPDDQLLLLAMDYRLFKPIDAQVPVRDEVLLLLDQSGEFLEAYSLMSAIGRNNKALPLSILRPTEELGKRFIDLLHANSADWPDYGKLVGTHPLYDPNNVLVCFRHQNRVAMFNWQTKKVVWSWGKGELYGPHDARLLDNGNILVFDNGLGEQRSRVVEMDPRTEAIVWQYVADPPGSFFTVSKGSAQRLANGNTLAVESDSGRAFEVTQAGEIVWEFICPHQISFGNRAAIVHMERYSVEFIDQLMTQPTQ